MTMPTRSHVLRGLAAGLLLALVPALAGAQEATEPEGIAALGFNLPGLIAQLINFGILLIVLRLFLYRPVVKLLDERKRRIEEGLNLAQEAATQASASQDDARRALEEARAEGRQLVVQAQESSARLRDELLERAETEAAQLVERARQEIGAERDHAIVQLRAEFSDLAIAAAEQVIGQSLDRAAHQRLIDEVLVNSELGQSN